LERTGYCIHLIRKNSAVISSLVCCGGVGWAGSPPACTWWLSAAARALLSPLYRDLLTSRGDLNWISGKLSLLKEWSGIGTGCPGQWWSHHPWRGSKNV